MDLKELSVSVEATATTTAVLKPTSVLASTISREYLKVLESREYCKMLGSDLKESETKVQLLIFSKSESAKIKADYIRRNKINATNSESLLHAKNELYKYKCGLKSNYIATEKSRKFKKLKYEKIISSYESDWQKALKEFNINPVVVELRKVEEENAFLEIKIKEQEKLNSCTERQFFELKKHIQLVFLKQMIHFSKVMIQYREHSKVQKQNKEIDLSKFQKNPERSFAFSFSLFQKEARSSTGRNSGSEINEYTNCSSSIDISIFDDVTVPLENLESQHLEEEIYSTSQNKEQLSGISKEQEDLVHLNKLKHYQQMEDQKIRKSLHSSCGSLIQNSAKTMIADEKESQYFRLQVSECSEPPKNVENNADKLKSTDGVSAVSTQNVQESEEDVHKEQQMEYEESLSDTSSENQFGRQRDIYDYQYRKVASFSSDEFPPSAENTNDGLESAPKPLEKQEGHLFRPGESSKTDLNSFARFFTMESDYDSPKPSIFKLF